MSETQQPLEHWPTERMVFEGHADYALPEDLEGLPEETLKEVAGICEVNEFAPDECVSCLAHTMWLELQRKKLEDMAPEEPHPGDIAVMPEVEDVASSEENEADDFTQQDVNHPAYDPVRDFSLPPVERLHHEVKVINEIMDEILHGPPIPPKDVTVEELALLALGATKWVESAEFNVSQGLELSSQQRQVLDATKALVARLRS